MGTSAFAGEFYVCRIRRFSPGFSPRRRGRANTPGSSPPNSPAAKPPPQTLVFDTPDIVSGFASAGYHTACIGGVGFFNKQTPLGSVLPGLFHESHWSPELGVASPDSTARQVDLASTILRDCRRSLFLFINVSAIHQPNCIFTPGAPADTLETHINALAYVDAQLPPLFAALENAARPWSSAAPIMAPPTAKMAFAATASPTR